jgi:hypothetical protein
MWVWVAMRCFFDADCTSSILMADAAFCALCGSPLSLPPQQGKRRAARGEVKPIGAGVECSADGEGLVEGGRDGPLLAGPNVIKPQLPAAWAQCNNAHLEGVRRIDIPFCDLFCQGPYQDFT